MRKIKVLFIEASKHQAYSNRPAFSGLQRCQKDMLNFMSQMPELEVTFVGTLDSERPPCSNFIQLGVYSKLDRNFHLNYPLGYPNEARLDFLFEVINEKNYDCVITNDFELSILRMPKDLRWPKRLKMIYFLHVAFNEIPDEKVNKRMIKKVIGLHDQGHKVVHTSTHSAQKWHEYTGRSFIDYLSSPVMLCSFRNNFSKQEKFCFVGRIERRKRIEDLIALSYLLKCDLDIVAGRIEDQEYFEMLKLKIKGMSFESRIHFHFGIEEPAKNKIIKESAFMAFSSESESFGIAAAEAISLGTRVVSINKMCSDEISYATEGQSLSFNGVSDAVEKCRKLLYSRTSCHALLRSSTEFHKKNWLAIIKETVNDIS